MKNAKNVKNNDRKNITTKIETVVADAKTEMLRVANVARELNLNEKRARSFLRHETNVATYNVFRNKTFTRNSDAYKKCVELLTAYKSRLSSKIAS